MVSQLVQQCEATCYCGRPGQLVIILSFQGAEVCSDVTIRVVNVQPELVATRGYITFITILYQSVSSGS